MTFQLLLLILGVTLFGGLFMGLYFSYLSIEADRVKVADRERREVGVEKQSFFSTPTMIDLRDEEHLLRVIEHHVRRELMAASNYVASPSPASLWLGVEPRVGSGRAPEGGRSKAPVA